MACGISHYVVFMVTLSNYLAECEEPLVHIAKPYHPFYLKATSTLELKCNSTERRELEWVRNTPATNWQDNLVEPTLGSNFITRTTVEEPTGNVESKLYIKQMSLLDRGLYKCQDKQQTDSHAVWIMVLHIVSNNVTAKPGESLTLHCNISGFDSNVPAMGTAWYRDDLYIPPDHPRYFMTTLGTSSSLVIKEPTKEDGKVHNCVFIFATSLGDIQLTHSAYVDVSDLPKNSQEMCIYTKSVIFQALLASLLFSKGLL